MLRQGPLKYLSGYKSYHQGIFLKDKRRLLPSVSKSILTCIMIESSRRVPGNDIIATLEEARKFAVSRRPCLFLQDANASLKTAFTKVAYIKES